MMSCTCYRALHTAPKCSPPSASTRGHISYAMVPNVQCLGSRQVPRGCRPALKWPCAAWFRCRHVRNRASNLPEYLAALHTISVVVVTAQEAGAAGTAAAGAAAGGTVATHPCVACEERSGKAVHVLRGVDGWSSLRACVRIVVYGLAQSC